MCHEDCFLNFSKLQGYLRRREDQKGKVGTQRAKEMGRGGSIKALYALLRPPSLPPPPLLLTVF